MNIIISPSQKTCSVCKEQKPLEAFHKPKGIYAAYCKECMNRLPAIQKELALDGCRLCTKCGTSKPLGDFLKRKASSDGYALECKSCKRQHDIEKHEQLLASPPRQITEKQCTKCKQIKSASEFYENTNLKCSSDRLASWCKECSRKEAIRRAGPYSYEKSREKQPRRYGLTQADYDAMFLAQNGTCAICKRPETKKQYSQTMALAIDHNHSTDTPRDLLCSDCNTALGQLKDDPIRIRVLISYLQREIEIIPLIVEEKLSTEQVTKVCPYCQIAKPLTEFHRNKAKEKGHHSRCKACRTLPTLNKRIISPEGYKRCSHCREIKPLESFYKSTKTKDGYECKKCNSERGHRTYLVPTETTIIIPESKQCRKCGDVKPIGQFGIKQGNQGKVYIDRWCEECAAKATLHKISKSRVHTVQSYGLTIEGYNTLLEARSGVCAVCELPETVKRYSKIIDLSIDHDHKDDRVRGLLCSTCNAAAGLVHDDIAILETMLAYLQKWA